MGDLERLRQVVRLRLAKWFSPPRLETRTKEFNMCASTRVIETHVRNESDFHMA